MGLVLILRWYWWRINAWSEISAMVVSFLVAAWFQANLVVELGGIRIFRFGQAAWGLPAPDPSAQLLAGVGITTLAWLGVTLLTPADNRTTLQAFFDRIRPYARGWRAAVDTGGGSAGDAGPAFLAWGLGCATVYGTLFATGMALYGRWGTALALGTAAAAAAAGLFRVLGRIEFE